MGYSHIALHHATAINGFYTETFNPYLNFHRPCYFAVDTIDAKGKIQKTYPHDQIMTPGTDYRPSRITATNSKPASLPMHSNTKPRS